MLGFDSWLPSLLRWPREAALGCCLCCGWVDWRLRPGPGDAALLGTWFAVAQLWGAFCSTEVLPATLSSALREYEWVNMDEGEVEVVHRDV